MTIAQQRRRIGRVRRPIAAAREQNDHFVALRMELFYKHHM